MTIVVEMKAAVALHGLASENLLDYQILQKSFYGLAHRTRTKRAMVFEITPMCLDVFIEPSVP